MPGQITVQAMHAMAEFLFKFKEKSEEWHINSNSICLLEADDINHLEEIKLKANDKNISFAEFYEPDYNNSLTAIALEPGTKTKKFCYHFKLALKDLEVK